MALSESEIRFNYNAALGKANDLDAAAKALKSDGVEELGSILVAIKRDWEGDNSDGYTKKGEKEKGLLDEIVEEMKRAASTIRQMAKNIYDAEMRALAEARAMAEAARKAAEK